MFSPPGRPSRLSAYSGYMNRRRLSPDERCEELLDAAEELFQTRSVDDVTMKDIAKHAGVTRALLYHYYPTKADLFGAIWSRAHERRERPVGGRVEPEHHLDCRRGARAGQ